MAICRLPLHSIQLAILCCLHAFKSETLKSVFCYLVFYSDTKSHVCYCHNFASAVCSSLSWLIFHILMVISETTEKYEAKRCRNDVYDVLRVILGSTQLCAIYICSHSKFLLYISYIIKHIFFQKIVVNLFLVRFYEFFYY